MNINKMIDVLKTKDRKSARLLLNLMLDTPDNPSIQKQFKKIIANQTFNRFLKKAIDDDFLGRDVEWVLVIPLKKYISNCDNQYELIFGIGQEISKRDLFLIWDSKQKKIFLLNLKYNEERRDIMSLHELHNLSTGYGLDMPKIAPHDKPISYASIENIKEYLELMLKDKNKNIFKKLNHDKFLLKPTHLKTEFKYLNITINILKDASLIFLKNAYDPRHNTKQDDSKVSLGYDPYSIVRNFLRFVYMYTERRGGIAKRIRYTEDQRDEIFCTYYKSKIKGEQKSLNDIIKELEYKQPSQKQLMQLENEAKRYKPTDSF